MIIRSTTTITSFVRLSRLTLALLVAVPPTILPLPAHAAGVTIITHGLWSDVTSWIWPMAHSITQYPRFPGTNSTCYEVKFVENAQGLYVPTETLVAGGSPTETDSGEVFIKLDWSAIANLGILSPGTSTSNIAYSAVSSILDTNFFPEMRGHSVAELPIHLIGHSRGGSVVSEIAKLLGERGIWVDQTTTLDPHPLNNDGFADPSVIVDAPVRAWANILFFDNYWQTNPDLTVPNGEPVAGAFNRYVGALSGGYDNAHMNVHLWYHGTIDLSTPATDSQASITSTERQTWWAPAEAQGAEAGFYYSLLGRGDRLSTNQPAGPGTPRIEDGLNQAWDFGAGVTPNRVALPYNTGEWPNIITFDLTGTNYSTLPAGTRVYSIVPGLVTTNSARMLFQYGGLLSTSATATVYLARDANVYSAASIPIFQATYAATGARVYQTTVTLEFAGATIPSGIYYVYAEISAGSHRRYLYAPEIIGIFPALTISSPTLTPDGKSQFRVSGIASERLLIQASTNLQSWNSISTNALSPLTGSSLVGTLDFVDNSFTLVGERFYRVQYLP